jgi:hypothetical protein
MKSENQSMNNEKFGQLCPNQSCLHKLGLGKEGWYICSACGILFYTQYSDSDYEDYKCYREDSSAIRGMIPADISTAQDLGASWASPDYNKYLLCGDRLG